MNTPSEQFRVRITVMLGSTDTDRNALEILNLLVAETPAEILGLFLEDMDLLALAELPVAREYCRLTHVERNLQAADLERQLRIQARAARQALASTAERIGSRWSFRTVRGSLASLLRDSASDMDLMLLGASRHTQPIPGYTAAATARRPVVVLFDGSEAARRALAVAVRVASGGNQPLSIVRVADRPKAAKALGKQARELAGAVALQFPEPVTAEANAMLAAVRAARPGILVIGMDTPAWSPESFDVLRNHLSCPLLLVK